MKSISVFFVLTILFSRTQGLCGSPEPLIRNPDYNGDGDITGLDLSELASHLTSDGNEYYAIYDLNADGEVDPLDVTKVVSSFDNQPTIVDKEIIFSFKNGAEYLGFKSMTQSQRTAAKLYSNNIELEGRGTYWFTPTGLTVLFNADFHEVNGFLVDENEDLVALVWAVFNFPSFRDPETGTEGPFDYFTCQPSEPNPRLDCTWMAYPVVAVNPAASISNITCEKWYHENYCMYEKDGEGHLDGYLTFNECVFGTQYDLSPSWINVLPTPVFWVSTSIMHMWLYDLNPNGLFARTHPCVSPNGWSQTQFNDRVINEFGRSVPSFFEQDNSHICDPYV